MYREMSPITGEFFDSMMEADALDVESRFGKWGGGYCTEIPSYRQPFILANFNGTSADVDVVTHEAGHALAAYLKFKQGYRDENLGMEVAETHSMSMEFFAWKYTELFFGKDAAKYRFMHLVDSFAFLPYGTIVDYFQHEAYEHPDWTPAERNARYLELEREFRPYLSLDGIPYLDKGTRWQYQMHIFEQPFYYIDYCFAQTIALQFLIASLEDYDGALARYFDHVKRGGQYSFVDLVEAADSNLLSKKARCTVLRRRSRRLRMNCLNSSVKRISNTDRGGVGTHPLFFVSFRAENGIELSREAGRGIER